MQSVLKHLGLVLATCGFVSTAQAQSVTLTPEQMRAVAAQAVVKGFPAQAHRLSSALLQRDPDDMDALLVHARASRDLGKYPESLRTARHAWSLADTPDEKFAASMAMAQALSSSGRRTAAQLWLRRAAEVAPNDRLKSIARRDFGYVRSRNKWSTYLSFNISPNSNINNGSSEETTLIPIQLIPNSDPIPVEFTLSPEAKALSGIQYDFGINTRYRLHGTKNSSAFLTFGLSHTAYELSEKSKEDAPDIKGSDYNQSTASVGFRFNQRIAGSRAGIGADVTFGRTWVAGDPYYDFTRIGTTVNYALSRTQGLNLRLSHEGQTALERSENSIVRQASIGFSTLVGKGSRLDLTLGRTMSDSDASYLEYTATQARARVTFAKPLFGTRLSLGLTARRKHHPNSSYTSEGRYEDKLSAEATFVMNTVEYYGFVPTVTLHTSKTEANVSRFDADEHGIKFGIRSSF